MKPASDTQSAGLGLIILLALLTALDAMAIDMYLPGMPSIAIAFGVDANRVQQTLSVFLAGLAIGQGLYGPLLDRFGRRIPLLVGITVFIFGSAMAALATTIEWLLVARFLQALGAAAGLVAPRAIIDDLFDLKQSAQKLSILMQVMMIAPVLAPIMGGMLLIYGDWHQIFWVMASLGVIGLVWSWYTLPDSLAIEQRTPISLKQTANAYWSLLFQPAFALYGLAGGFVLGAFFVYISASSFIFIEHFQLSSTQYSGIFALNSVGLIMGGMVSNLLLKRGHETWHIMMLGVLIYTLAGGVLLSITALQIASLTSYGLLLSVAIASLGLVFGNLIALNMHAAESPAGVASAMMGMMQYLFSAVIGWLASQFAVSLGQLPATITFCGTLALICCWLAHKASQSRTADITLEQTF